MADPLTIDDLIAWGRDWERHLKEGPHDEREQGFTIPLPLLEQYITAANAALIQQREQASKKAEKKSSGGGRPPGGMGERVLRLMDSGVLREDAERIAAQEQRRPTQSAKRAAKRASKKPPS